MELEGDDNDDDDLRPARGVGYGCVMGVLAFIAIGLAVILLVSGWLVVKAFT